MTDIIILTLLFLTLISLTGYYLYSLFFNKQSALFQWYCRLETRVAGFLKLELKDQSTKSYLLSFITTNMLMTLVCYLILRLQAYLPWNPNGIDNMAPDLSFNTVISFITNTNLQHYSGETGLSYFSQMAVITFLMFTSAASGFALCIAFIRRLLGKSDWTGSFNRDIVKFIMMVLLPLSFIVSLILVSQGSLQNLSKNISYETLEGQVQILAQGPVASLESIKHLGTNGGGFFGANASTPFENPTVISNMTEMLSMMLIPGSLIILFSILLYKYKMPSKKQGYFFLGILLILFFCFLALNLTSEMKGNPLFETLNLSDTSNLEGKETRFDIVQSALFTTVTTSFTTGTVNNMHDSQTALGGMVPLVLMMMNAVFGGEGVGFMNFMTYVFLTIFIAGLMIGRTPQVFGKKFESNEMKLVAIALLVHPTIILCFTALATIFGSDAVSNPGMHGLSQMLYEYTSSSANNGSGFEGLGDNTPFWNVTTGLAMFFGRFPAMILQLYIVSLLVKKPIRDTSNELAIDTPVFSGLLLVIVVVFSALTFLPALILGPIGEFLSQ